MSCSIILGKLDDSTRNRIRDAVVLANAWTFLVEPNKRANETRRTNLLVSMTIEIRTSDRQRDALST